jgi:hypothetical protein
MNITEANADRQPAIATEPQAKRENVESIRQPLTVAQKFQFLAQVKDDSELAPLCLHIAFTVLNHQNNQAENPLRGYAWLGWKALAEICHASERTVARCLARMKRRGHIGSKRRFDSTCLLWPILKSDLTKMSGSNESDLTKMSGPSCQKRQVATCQKRHPKPLTPKPKKETIDKNLLPGGFDEWWNAYPRKTDKAKALKAYRQALKDTPAETLLAGAERYAIERHVQDPTYTKYPASWLNGRCWDNEPAPSRPASSTRRPATQLERAAPGGISYLETGGSVDEDLPF